MMRLWWLIPSPIRRALAWVAGAIAVAWGFYQAGRRSAHQDNAQAELENELEAHERMNNADLGSDDSDAVLRRKLHDFAKRNGG